MNISDKERSAAGISIHWPVTDNIYFLAASLDANAGQSPNNISPIISYSLNDGAKVMWMGDLETTFIENIADELDLPQADILFAPHHGRDSGRVPAALLEKINPKIIVIGEAPCEHLNYYPGYNKICQNTAGDIIFDCQDDKVHIFTSNEYDTDYLDNEYMVLDGYHYAGTLNLNITAKV